MRLYRTICSTDFKGRPDHKLRLLGDSDNQEWLVELMNKDILDWQAWDIVADEENEEENEDTFDPDARHAELLANPEQIGSLWAEQDRRWEMRLHNAIHREFVDKLEGDLTTIVYHFGAEGES